MVRLFMLCSNPQKGGGGGGADRQLGLIFQEYQGQDHNEREERKENIL